MGMRPPHVPLAFPVGPEGSSHGRGSALDPEEFVQELERELLRQRLRVGALAWCCAK